MTKNDKINRIYNKLETCKEIKDKLKIYNFIEILLINGYDKLYNLLINGFKIKKS